MRSSTEKTSSKETWVLVVCCCYWPTTEGLHSRGRPSIVTVCIFHSLTSILLHPGEQLETWSRGFTERSLGLLATISALNKPADAQETSGFPAAKELDKLSRKRKQKRGKNITTGDASGATLRQRRLGGRGGCLLPKALQLAINSTTLLPLFDCCLAVEVVAAQPVTRRAPLLPSPTPTSIYR